MTKRHLLLLLMLMLSSQLHAQKFKEWFRQKKTQKAYLIEQIAQLKIYLELAQKGYQIAQSGLTTISEIKAGEFKLHKNRFDSLLIVKPQVSSYSRLRQITDMQDIVHQICKRLPFDVASCPALDQTGRDRVQRAIELLYDDGQSLIGDLLLLIRDKNYAMTDDQRLQRIEWLYEQFEANYSFATDYQMQLSLLCNQVSKEQQELFYQGRLHGLNR